MGIARNAELTITLTAQQVARLECVLQIVRLFDDDEHTEAHVSEIYEVLRQAERTQLGTYGI
jgi:hypothetical protein